MEVTRQTQKLTVWDQVLRERLKCPVHQDVIVPDTMPDMVHIIESSTAVTVSSRSALPGQAEAELILECCIVYQGEDEGQWCLHASLPVTACGRNESIMPGDLIAVNVLTAEATARSVNSRKVSVGALIQVEMTVYKKCEKLLCIGLEGNARGVETLTRRFSAELIRDAAEKEFTVRDSFRLDPEKSGAEEIESVSVTAGALDHKCIGSKLVIKGQLSVQCCYRSFEGSREQAAFQLPFSELAELAGEDCQVDLCFMAKSVRLQPDGESYYEGRSLSMEVELALVVTARQQLETQLLCDAYCPGQLCECSYETLLLGQESVTQLAGCSLMTESRSRRCAFILCRPKESQSLWDVAKQWGARQEQILSVNAADAGIPQSAMLLIPTIDD